MKRIIKKILLVSVIAVAALLFASCEQAEVTSTLVITNEAGAGEKTITFAIPADRETVVEAGDNNGVEYHIYNNSTYFPQGYAAFCDWILARLPDKGYTYEIRDDDASYVYIDVKYSFNSFEEYAEKTRALMGEERWTKGNFYPTGWMISRVEDPNDNNYGKICRTLVESRYITSACVDTIVEIGICQEAVNDGVLEPYGNSFNNADCRQMFIDYEPSEETFEEFADVYYLAKPGSIYENVSERTYIYGDETHVERLGRDGMVSAYLPDDGSYALTDISAWLPEGADSGFLSVLEDGIYVLTPKADIEDDGVWSIDDFDKTKVVLGSKAPGPKSLESNLVPLKSDFPVWIIIVIVAVVAVVTVVVILLRRANEYEDEDEEDDDDEDDEEQDDDDN